MNDSDRPYSTGFTLIEMSIVLVIIGLIVGGVLTGRDLIRAAEVRAQISQIDGYNTAVNTFRDKYGGLPGDLEGEAALKFGFAPRGPYRGEGDGNNLLEGIYGSGSTTHCGYCEGAGELVMFWQDLGRAGLIAGAFDLASSDVLPHIIISGTQLSGYFPTARIGRGSFVYVWSDGDWGSGWEAHGTNYFGLSGVTKVDVVGRGGAMESRGTLSAMQAFNIDKKIDDGLPQSGTVTAQLLDANYSPANWVQHDNGPSDHSSTPPSSTSCYDDDGTPGATRHYSINVMGGAGATCGLSFEFQ